MVTPSQPTECTLSQTTRNGPQLRRTLSLPQLILYGLGTTVGAGIYALLGEISSLAGYLAPWSFVVAGALASLTAISFAVLSSRYPRAAGVALYVQQGTGSAQLARIVGLLAIGAGLVSSAALFNGLVGYTQEFFDLARPTIILSGVIGTVVIACWGINQSVWLAGTITLVEIGGLIWASILAGSAWAANPTDLAVFVPADTTHALPFVLSGAVLAFYAYIGFEDMIEVAEEVQQVKRNLPIAIIVTLIATTVLYVLLIATALLATGPQYLANSSAPLADLFRAVSEINPATISAIALLALVNGALIQIIMASRIMYGLASRGQLPVVFARINPTTQTPITATLIAGSLVTIMALSGTVAILAEITSVIILCLFLMVNLSLLLLELRAPKHPGQRWLTATAALGIVACAGLVIQAVFT